MRDDINYNNIIDNEESAKAQAAADAAAIRRFIWTPPW